MSYQEVISDLQNLTFVKEKVSYTLPYTTFLNLQKQIKELYGPKGVLLFTENRAVACFDNFPNIRIIITSEKSFVKEDFKDESLNLTLIGSGAGELKSTFMMFLDDLNYNKKKILLVILLYLCILNPTTSNLPTLVTVTEKLLDITSIFIGMVFVFIGFFYGDKERTIDVYKKGLGDKEYRIDKYIIEMAVIVLVFLAASLGICGMNPESLKVLESVPIDLIEQWQYVIGLIITGVALTLLTILFDSLISYYLKSMRNKYFINAVDEVMKERTKKERSKYI